MNLLKKLVLSLIAVLTCGIVMSQDTAAFIKDSGVLLQDTIVTQVVDSVEVVWLQDTGIADDNFMYPMLYILAVSILGFYSAKIPYLNKITDTKMRSVFGAAGLGVVFSLAFGVSILQLAIAYGVASGIVYDLIIKKLGGLESFKVDEK